MLGNDQLAAWVTFTPNQFHRIHSWFYYKEGYSKELIEWLLNEYGLKEPFLDPFCGSGTTPLALKELGFSSIGLDVSPLALFVSRVKTRNYNVEKLKVQLEELKKFYGVFEKPLPDIWWVKRFHRPVLRELLALKERILQIEDSAEREFFLFALVDSTLRVANVERRGASLKTVKKPVLRIKRIFEGKVIKMLKDLEKAQLSDIEPIVVEGDARFMKLVASNSMNSIITSPPYLNKIEYASAYKLENAIYFNEPSTMLRSFMAKSTSDLSSPVPVIEEYFSDMKNVLKEMHRILNSGGKAVIVVAGGCFPDRIVESDDRIIGLAKEVGFNLVEKKVARLIQCHKFRSIKTGKVRESVIVLEKP